MDTNFTEIIPVNSVFLIGVFIFLLLYTAFTLITIYHWRAYANNELVAKKTIRWYLVSTIGLLVIAFVTFVVSLFT